MATVVLNQPTDMNALPTGVSFSDGKLINPVLDLHNDNSYFNFVGTFSQPAGGGALGTINDAWFDTPDFDHIPDLEITGLSFSFDVSYFNAFIITGRLDTLILHLLEHDDTLIGSSGNDVLLGHDGDDTMFGGPGAGSAPDGADLFGGGLDSDTVSYANAPAGLFAGLEDFNFNTGAALGDSYVAVENLIGSAFSDTLYGTGGVNRLSGGGGNDTMVGKAGGDTFDGGAGSDTVAYDASFALRADLLLPGTNTGFAAGDVYISIENLAGSSNSDVLLGNNAANVISGNLFPNLQSGRDHLFGRSGNDTLRGNDDNDLLDGGLGNDILVGGAGNDSLRGGPDNDVYVLENGADAVSDAGGIDTATSTISRSLAVGGLTAIENLTLVNVATSLNGTGNNLANIINGNDFKNVFDGGLGNDRLLGQGGNDTLSGNLGKDTSTGGAGNDIFKFTAASQSAVGANADVVTDFDKANDDRIDLSAVFGGVLAYRHNGAFTAAGQVRINDIAGADVLVEVNTGGSLAADMQIRLAGTTLGSMASTDFVL